MEILFIENSQQINSRVRFNLKCVRAEERKCGDFGGVSLVGGDKGNG